MVKHDKPPAKALLLLCCLAAGLAAQASAVEVLIHPTSTGFADGTFFRNGDPPYYAKYGPDLQYGVFLPNSSYAHNDNAFLKFSLDTLPDTCVIVSAELHYYQHQHWVGSPQVDAKLIRDPDSLSSEGLWAEISAAPAVTSVYESQDGWMSVPFDTAAFSLLDSCRHAGWCSFGIREENAHTFMGLAYGQHGTNPPYLRIEYVLPNETDIQALRAELLTYPLVAQSSDTALLTLTNKGVHASGAFWAHAGLGITSESALVEPIDVGETVSVRVPLPFSPYQDTMIGYRLWANDRADDKHSNDSTQFQCWSFPAGTYAEESFDEPGFPPPGWLVVNGDSGTHCWARQSASGRSHSGEGFASCSGESTGTSDDWLTSSPIYPTGDYKDSIGFFTRGISWLASDTLDVLVWGRKHTLVALLSLDAHDVSYSRHTASLDACDGDTIRVAFRHRSKNALYGIYLDDIWFSRVYAPDTSDTGHVELPHRDAVQRNAPELPELAFARNPVHGGFAVVRCSLVSAAGHALTLRNIAGNTVGAFILGPSGVTRLDLSGFAPGVYFATLDADNRTISRKLVITAR